MTLSHTRTFTRTERILEQVNAERRRQVVELGYDADHDDAKGVEALGLLAANVLAYGFEMSNEAHRIKGLALMVATVEAQERADEREVEQARQHQRDAERRAQRGGIA